jgi:hypothetical protein
MNTLCAYTGRTDFILLNLVKYSSRMSSVCTLYGSEIS